MLVGAERGIVYGGEGGMADLIDAGKTSVYRWLAGESDPRADAMEVLKAAVAGANKRSGKTSGNETGITQNSYTDSPGPLYVYSNNASAHVPDAQSPKSSNMPKLAGSKVGKGGGGKW